MEADSELLDAFAAELLEIKKELEPIMAVLKTDPNRPEPYERFAQCMNRIYGTASTLGYKEIGIYCDAINKICYKCSQTQNIYAMGQVKELCAVAFGLLEKFSTVIKNPTELRKVQYLMQKEGDRADLLSKRIFNTISRTTLK